MERLTITLTVEVQVEVAVKKGATINLFELKRIKEDALREVERMMERPFVEGTDVEKWYGHSDIKMEPSEVPFLSYEEEEEEGEP